MRSVMCYNTSIQYKYGGLLIMKEPLVSKTLRVTLYVIFAIGAFTTLTMPFMIDYYLKLLYDAYEVIEGYRSFIVVFLMLVGTMGLFIVFNLAAMLRTISGGPFVVRNVRSLNRIGVTSFITAGLFFIKCFFYVTILTLAFGCCLVLCGMFALVLAVLFDRAVKYKEENDLTI